MRRWLFRMAAGGAAVVVVLQLVPYGWWHENPPVTLDVPWPDAASAELARGACYDCHSNETEWPVYSYVAPMSWLVRRDVEQGRDELNFSEWDQGENEAHDAAEEVEDGSMPPRQYRLLHPDARLSDAEVAQLATALDAMDDDRGGGDDGDNSGRGSDNSGRGGDHDADDDDD